MIGDILQFQFGKFAFTAFVFIIAYSLLIPTAVLLNLKILSRFSPWHCLRLGIIAIFRPPLGKCVVKLNGASFIVFVFIRSWLDRTDITRVFARACLCLPFRVFEVLDGFTVRYIFRKSKCKSKSKSIQRQTISLQPMFSWETLYPDSSKCLCLKQEIWAGNFFVATNQKKRPSNSSWIWNVYNW